MKNYFSTTFNFGKISLFKMGIAGQKKMNQNFLQICTSTQYDLLNHNNKVSPNSVENQCL